MRVRCLFGSLATVLAFALTINLGTMKQDYAKINVRIKHLQTFIFNNAKAVMKTASTAPIVRRMDV